MDHDTTRTLHYKRALLVSTAVSTPLARRFWLITSGLSSLIEHAMPRFRDDGHGLINSIESLWKILRNAIKDPQAGPVIMVLDALDECAESEFADLMRNIENLFRSGQSGYGRSCPSFVAY
jgi:hypothetical protein